MTKVAINGMGRIGRAAFKIVMEQSELELDGGQRPHGPG